MTSETDEHKREREANEAAIRADERSAERAKVVAWVLFVAGPIAAVVSWKLTDNVAEHGQAGDFFGGHLAGFGNLAAFLMMFAAFMLQRAELRTALLEAKAQTIALNAQQEALFEQAKAMQETARATLHQLELGELLRLQAEAETLRVTFTLEASAMHPDVTSADTTKASNARTNLSRVQDELNSVNATGAQIDQCIEELNEHRQSPKEKKPPTPAGIRQLARNLNVARIALRHVQLSRLAYATRV